MCIKIMGHAVDTFFNTPTNGLDVSWRMKVSECGLPVVPFWVEADPPILKGLTPSEMRDLFIILGRKLAYLSEDNTISFNSEFSFKKPEIKRSESND